MSLTSEEAVKRGSVSTAFYKSLFSIYLISILLAIPSVYFLTKDELYSQANKELKIIVDVVRSARAIVKERTRPHFLPKGVFFPTVVSSTVMAKELATHFKKLQPSYLIRMVSDNPLNQENYPNGLELKVLELLRNNDTENRIKMTGVIDNRSYLISATATKVSEGCLVCHGSPTTAPQEITNSYGKTSGYGWKPGSIIGANLVGVPVADLNTAVLKRFALVTGAITVLFAFVLLVLTRVVQRQIIEPIQDLTKTANEVSLGRSNNPVKSQRNDEIGALTRSFELMRRSISIATKKINKLTEAKDD